MMTLNNFRGGLTNTSRGFRRTLRAAFCLLPSRRSGLQRRCLAAPEPVISFSSLNCVSSGHSDPIDTLFQNTDVLRFVGMVGSRKMADLSNSGTNSDYTDRKILENRFPIPGEWPIYRISDLSESDLAKHTYI